MKTHILCAFLAGALCLPAYASNNVVQGKATFQTFPVPGTEVGLYNLSVQQISDTGFIAGTFTINNSPYSSEGFLRSPNGKITDLNDPQGDSPYFGPYSGGVGVNALATVAGYFYDYTNLILSGFLYNNGKFINYNVPGLATGSNTLIYGVNDFGEFCGYYQEPPDYAFVPFLNSAGRIITNFNIPGSVETLPFTVNDFGQAAGSWFDSSGVEHGFVRNPNGAIIEIDVPGAGTFGTAVYAVNSLGWVSGHFWSGPNNYEHGFVRSPNGVYYQIDVPGAAANLVGGGTSGGALNDEGVLVGHFDPEGGGAEQGYIATLSFYPR